MLHSAKSVKQMPKRFSLFWQTHFLGVEAFLALLLAVVFAFFLGLAEGFDQQVTEVLNGNRQAVYGRVAGISGTLMGFGIAVAAFIIPSVMSSERFRLLRVNENFDSLWRTYSQVVKSFGLLTVSSLVCLIVDTDASPYLWSWSRGELAGSTTLSARNTFRTTSMSTLSSIIARTKSSLCLRLVLGRW